MRRVTMSCRRCGLVTRLEVLDPDEEADPRIPRRPLRCPQCASTSIVIEGER